MSQQGRGLAAAVQQLRDGLAALRAERQALSARDAQLAVDEEALRVAVQALRARGGRAQSRSNGATVARPRGGRPRPGELTRRDEMLRILKAGPQTKQTLADAMGISTSRARELLDELRDQGHKIKESKAPDNPRAKVYAVA